MIKKYKLTWEIREVVPITKEMIIDVEERDISIITDRMRVRFTEVIP